MKPLYSKRYKGSSSILDPQWAYTPSYRTDVKATIERERKRIERKTNTRLWGLL